MSAGITRGNRRPSREERAARDAKVRQMREDGATFQQIGDALGCTRQMAHLIYKRITRHVDKPAAGGYNGCI